MDLSRWDAEGWLAAIVEDADYAIVSKSVDGIIMTWNAGAERLFGYQAHEAVGQPIYLLIPENRREEEDEILRQIRAGKHVPPFETVRRRKDGSEFDVALSVSPIRDRSGAVVGASKLARDITERKRLQEQQVLLLHEMNHRVKNLFTLAGTVVALSARDARTPEELSQAVQQRLASLAAAHQLTLLSAESHPTVPAAIATFAALIRAIVAPYQEEGKERVRVSGDDIDINPSILTSLALLLHEFTSNAVQYGALSTCSGRINIQISNVGGHVTMSWIETGGPAIERQPMANGFGSRMEALVSRTLGADISRHWRKEGLLLELAVPMSSITLRKVDAGKDDS